MRIHTPSMEAEKSGRYYLYIYSGGSAGLGAPGRRQLRMR